MIIKFYPILGQRDVNIAKPNPKRESFVQNAYRCKPLVRANQAGFDLTLVSDLDAEWTGGDSKDSVTVYTGNAVSHFGMGTLTLHLAAILRTPPGYSIMMTPPPNPNPGEHILQMMSGLIETDWSEFPFTLNLRFMEKGRVKIKAGTPIARIFPFKRPEEQVKIEKHPIPDSVKDTYHHYRDIREGTWPNNMHYYRDNMEERGESKYVTNVPDVEYLPNVERLGKNGPLILRNAFDAHQIMIMIRRTVAEEDYNRPQDGGQPKCDMFWPDRTNEDWKRLDELIMDAMQRHGRPSSREADLNLTILKYEVGDFQPEHWDWKDLALSCSLIVQNAKKGGDFLMHGKKQELYPGDIIIFNADKDLHEILPVEEGTRIVLTRMLAKPETVEACNASSEQKREEMRSRY